MDVIYLLKKIGYKPRRTIRCVLFQNEENGLAGGREYAKVSNDNKEFHFAAIESDAGGFTPQGFSFDSDSSALKNYLPFFKTWDELLSPYDIHFDKGGSGADVGPLRSQKGILFGLKPILKDILITTILLLIELMLYIHVNSHWDLLQWQALYIY